MSPPLRCSNAIMTRSTGTNIPKNVCHVVKRKLTPRSSTTLEYYYYPLPLFAEPPYHLTYLLPFRVMFPPSPFTHSPIHPFAHSPIHPFTPHALPSPPSPPSPPPPPSVPSVPGPTTAVAARWPRVTRRREYANSLSYHTYNLTIFPAHTIVLCASTIPDRSSLTKSELTRGRSSYLFNRLF